MERWRKPTGGKRERRLGDRLATILRTLAGAESLSTSARGGRRHDERAGRCRVSLRWRAGVAGGKGPVHIKSCEARTIAPENGHPKTRRRGQPNGAGDSEFPEELPIWQLLRQAALGGLPLRRGDSPDALTWIYKNNSPAGGGKRGKSGDSRKKSKKRLAVSRGCFTVHTVCGEFIQLHTPGSPDLEIPHGFADETGNLGNFVNETA